MKRDRNEDVLVLVLAAFKRRMVGGPDCVIGLSTPRLERVGMDADPCLLLKGCLQYASLGVD